MRKALLVVTILMMVGCGAPRFDLISVGMTKEQVRAALGEPDSIAVQRSTEYWNYERTNSDGLLPVQYIVRFLDGKAETYGRSGDFDLTKDPIQPIQKVIIDRTDNIKMDSVTKFDLATELAKLDKLKKDGLISAEDYELLKKRAIEKAKE